MEILGWRFLGQEAINGVLDTLMLKTSFFWNGKHGCAIWRIDMVKIVPILVENYSLGMWIRFD
jgi:hypothetical protein